MHRPSIRQLAIAAVLALVVIAPTAGCGSKALSPLPVQPASQPSASASSTPTATPSASKPPANAPPNTRTSSGRPRPTRPPIATPTETSSCMGAIRYDVDLANTELALLTSLCFKVGAVLRLQGIGPGLVTVDPQSLVSQNYEAGVVDIRFVRTGTVKVNIPKDEQVYTITVVVIG